MAEDFLKYDYAETKDLLKTFITLISATLVFSITFSEKVVKIERVSRKIKIILMTAWSLLIWALIAAGLGMCFIAAAAGKAIYGSIPIFDYQVWTLALASWGFILVAGISYVGGLTALAAAAAHSMTATE